MQKNDILILTPDPKDVMFQGRWRDLLERLINSLKPFNIHISYAPWTEPLHKLSLSAELVLPLLAWGYQRAHPHWVESCNEWQKHQIPLLNPPHILQWNSDKHYLKDLSERGASVVPSLYCENVTHSKLQESLSVFDVDKVVLKPTVSATAYKTSLWAEGEPITDPPDGPCIIQPFLQSILTEGEVSLIFIDGQFSHGLRKTPATGDFRVQPEFGGCLTPYFPDQIAIKVAKKILKCMDVSLLYARIDLVLDDAGNWLLLEAELIEPDLFLNFDNRNGEVLGAAILNRIQKGDLL